MSKGRLEAFSDGVIAILITIMVLELRVPQGGELEALRPIVPVFLTYVMSFVFLGIYWNNHHHMFCLADRINGKILWANLHLLFWLSLVPFVTGWMGENHFESLPTAVYGFVLLACAIAWTVLKNAIVKHQGLDSRLAAAIGRDLKGRASAALYALAVPGAFVFPPASIAVYMIVTLMWLVPDRRVESALERAEGPSRKGSAAVAVFALVFEAIAVSGCGGEWIGPSSVSLRGTIRLAELSPVSGSTIVVSDGSPPGAFIQRHSGKLSIGLSINADRKAPWAQLNVYLLSGDSYCAQNLPDAPTWGPFPIGRSVSYAVTGFQVYRLPCDVTGIRAMLHLRNNGSLVPPTPTETIAEGTFAASYQLRK